MSAAKIEREKIYAALFEKLKMAGEITAVNTISRKFRHFVDVPSGEQPALFQLQVAETYRRRRGLPPVITLEVHWYLYIDTSEDSNASPAILINPIVDAMEQAIEPDYCTSDVQTLGGLVSHAWIEGTEKIYEGNLGNQAIVQMIINILISGSTTWEE